MERMEEGRKQSGLEDGREVVSEREGGGMLRDEEGERKFKNRGGWCTKGEWMEEYLHSGECEIYKLCSDNNNNDNDDC